jgi:hypothetical protein
VTTHLAVCGVGAVLAMAGHFPGRPRFWVPHAVGLAAMLLAWLPGTPPAGMPVALLTLAVVLGWQLRALPSARDRWAGCSDTVAMAALIALSAVPADAASAGTAAMHHGTAVHGAGDGLAIALAVLACWLFVRVCTWLPAPDPARPGAVLSRAGVVRSGGGLLMLGAMTTMVA